MSYVKQSTIRGSELNDCPFGLPIPNACMCVGEAINRMVPAKNKKMIKANRLVYAYHKGCKECPFADRILEKYSKVNCSFGDTAQGMKSIPFKASPLYPNTFSGIGFGGLSSFPLGYYVDNDNSRNLFLGLFSLLGHNTTEDLLKLADHYDTCGENEKADMLDNVLSKLGTIKLKYSNIFNKIEKYFAEYKNHINKNA